MSKSYLMNTYGRFNVTFDKGEGTKLYDKDGNEYIDFVSGVAVNCLGHCNPSIVKAIEEQSSKLMHVSNYYWNENAMELTEILCKNSEFDKVFMCNSGTEAIEAGLKLARKYALLHGDENKKEIIYMDNSFHGRTMGALSVTGQPKYQESFKPLIGAVKSVKFNDLDDIKQKISSKTAAVIVEPIQGEGGIIPAKKEYLKLLRDLCDENNALLIFDEVQCGMGRVGSLFAYQKFEVVPDIVCIAKALGGGFPIGAMLAKESVASSFVPGDHGNTYGGNPLACAVAIAVLKELVDKKVVEINVNEKSKYLFDKLMTLKEKYKVINDVRGMGLLIGVEVACDVKKIINKCFESKLLLITAGKNVVRFLPPLNVSFEEIDKALGIFEESIK
ncbi:acetylornithine/N-succinyldiaminopimelate aminotransferase [Clostridium acetobutylicum]|uniref:Acetylornithine aminotransferase n=1 Tax=Clostridium acetobutylicum (strain ATCC 824 / DSM 792 / JCM 1419 / IAM 19013 / LMG 5710 / NBRC 13948 / NRRL B-527 / VKM B-1787 / 2291 / W) TaxID=272562 RepID=ARGD_CLOAB|nr:MULTISPECIES: aspartate aminotransferase family protein [Clostridium]Q97GH9.1 RecName: Full=Acetylornithine aminotransferase; Short=ACOAT [Clostridium acetobutylicum ATCC 824]AAK80343.1 N-acetylornithine aminotransferase [Clostridium acetobutylicum ATCC 824]ADZ21440.1 N-acetylornithine aminotransferase [Clostridium acetobutylicum EA 2018]AEI34227.1 acetylornithine aminotransferase [Clostridium acetobutylicum DSM 1731]AWV79236.1 aspartate aminotransferase family protein [Clostridium acetobut